MLSQAIGAAFDEGAGKAARKEEERLVAIVNGEDPKHAAKPSRQGERALAIARLLKSGAELGA